MSLVISCHVWLLSRLVAEEEMIIGFELAQCVDGLYLLIVKLDAI